VAGGFEQAVLRVYDAALDSAQWPIVLQDVCRSIEATSALFFTQDLRTGETELISSFRFTQAELARYGEYYHRHDLWAEAVKAFPLGLAHRCSDLVPDRVFEQSEIWNDYGSHMRPGVFFCIGASVAVDRTHAGIVGFHRPRDARNFLKDDCSRVGHMLPHLQRALQVRASVAHAVNAERLAHAVLESLETAVVTVRENGSVAYANGAAIAIDSRNDGFSLGSQMSCVSGLRARETAELRMAIAKAARTTAGKVLESGGIVLLPRAHGERPYVVIVSPLSIKVVREPLALLVVIDPERRPSPPSSLLIRVFGLTAAEARLAIAMCRGLTLTEAAWEFCLSRHTVRTQLRRVFAKTGTTRQAALIRLLGSLMQVRNGPQ
jgi:DNA-binding CsgD family transcriptional regulator